MILATTKYLIISISCFNFDTEPIQSPAVRIGYEGGNSKQTSNNIHGKIIFNESLIC